MPLTGVEATQKSVCEKTFLSYHIHASMFNSVCGIEVRFGYDTITDMVLKLW